MNEGKNVMVFEKCIMFINFILYYSVGIRIYTYTLTILFVNRMGNFELTIQFIGQVIIS